MRKSFLSALAIAFLDNFGYSLVFILFAPLILDPQYGFFSADVSDGTKNVLLGVLIGIFPLFTFFGAPFWGDVGDRWGRKKALIFTILGTLFGHLVSAFAILAQNYLFLLFARAVAGLFSGNISLCLATISDVSPDAKTKAHNFGILTVCLGLGWILAMLLGGYLSDPTLVPFFSPALPFYVVTVLTFFGYLIVKFWFLETHPHRSDVHFNWMKSIHDIRSALSTPEMRPFLCVLFLWSFGWFFTFQWFTPVSLEAYGMSQEVASSHLVVLGISWVVGGVLLNSFLVKKFSSFTLSIFSILFTVLFVLFSSLAGAYFFFSLFFWITALAAPISLSNLLNVVSSSAPPGIQGKAMGFTQSLQSLAGVFVPFVGGGLAIVSIQLIFPVSALILLFALIFLVRLHPVKK